MDGLPAGASPGPSGQGRATALAPDLGSVASGVGPPPAAQGSLRATGFCRAATRGIVWGLLILGIAGIAMALTAGLAAADAPDRGREHPNVVSKGSVAATGHTRPSTRRIVHAPPVIKTAAARSKRTAHVTTERSARDGMADIRQMSKPTVQRVRDVTGTVEHATRTIAAGTVENAGRTVKSATRGVAGTVADLVDGAGEALPQGEADDPPGPADRSTTRHPPSTGQALPDRSLGPADTDSELPGFVTTMTLSMDHPPYGALDENDPAQPAPRPDIPAGTTLSSLGESRGGRCDRYGGSAVGASAHDLTAVGSREYSHRLLVLGMVVRASDPLGPQPGRQPGTTPD